MPSKFTALQFAIIANQGMTRLYLIAIYGLAICVRFSGADVIDRKFEGKCCHCHFQALKSAGGSCLIDLNSGILQVTEVTDRSETLFSDIPGLRKTIIIICFNFASFINQFNF